METTLEKGKGPIIGKLRTLTLIEGDLQMNMRMHLNSDGEELIERDDRFSKSNHGSRKNYSIETAMLEKRLVAGDRLIQLTPTAHDTIDLQSSYDRKLANIGSVLEEAVARNRQAMKLCTKIMPKFKRCASAGHGVSKSCHGGNEEAMAGTGQGNKFSGGVCRDASCLMTRSVEKMG